LLEAAGCGGWSRLLVRPVANSQCAINNRGNRDIMGHDENSYSSSLLSWRNEGDDLLGGAESSSPVGSSASSNDGSLARATARATRCCHRRKAGRSFLCHIGQANDLQQFGGAASVARAADTFEYLWQIDIVGNGQVR